jgi:hypothetical protein
VRSERALKPAESRVTLDVATFKTRFNLTRKHAIRCWNGWIENV